MASIHDLEDVSEAIFSGLEAINAGKADIGTKRLAMARTLMSDMDVASQTRQRIQQTQQSKELFPSVRTASEEGAAQAKQATATGAREANQAEDLIQLLADLEIQNVDPVKLTAALKARRGLEVSKLRDTPKSFATEASGLEAVETLALKQTETAIGAEPLRAKALEAGLSAEVSQNVTKQIRADAMRRYDVDDKTAQFLADNVGIEVLTAAANAAAAKSRAESQKLTAETKAKEQQTIEDNRKLLLAEMKKRNWTEGKLLYYETAVKQGFELTEAQFQQHRSLLTRTIAEIQQAPTISAAVDAAAKSAELKDSGLRDTILNAVLKGGQDRPILTTQDKKIARTIIRKLLNDMIAEHNLLRPDKKLDLFVLPTDGSDGAAGGGTDGATGSPLPSAGTATAEDDDRELLRRMGR